MESVRETLAVYLTGVSGAFCTLPFQRIGELARHDLPEAAAVGGLVDGRRRLARASGIACLPVGGMGGGVSAWPGAAGALRTDQGWRPGRVVRPLAAPIRCTRRRGVEAGNATTASATSRNQLIDLTTFLPSISSAGTALVTCFVARRWTTLGNCSLPYETAKEGATIGYEMVLGRLGVRLSNELGAEDSTALGVSERAEIKAEGSISRV